MTSSDERFEKGEVLLGKLEVIRVLGEGGMGVVYEVEHQITKHRRALKLLHAHISDDSAVTARLLREASVAGTLRTKHVVETFDAGQLASGAAYVLMEMLEGRSFAEVLEDGRPPPGRVVSLMWEACEGLGVAHRGGIVHRDLKPDNMFVATDLDGSEIVKLLDFGISKFSERHDYQGTLTADGAIMGTPFYMSPEQTRGLKDIDGRTDIYAMGVILYEALSGVVPFNAETFPMLVVNIHEGRYMPLNERMPEIDPGLAAVVHKAMSKERDDRYASVRDLQEALRPFADCALPERIGADSALALEGTLMSDAPPPRVSAVSTPMAVDDRTKPPEDAAPTGKRWPLYAGVGLAALGLVGLAVALGGGTGSSAGGAGLEDAGRGLVADPDTGPEELVRGIEIPADASLADVVDARADADASAAEVIDEETPTMERVPMGMGMRSGMSMNGTVSMGGIVIYNSNPF